MLELRNLVKVYPGPVAALQGVSLEVPMGMFGLLGPNGAGKTTLMRIVAGLLEPTSGTVHFNGEDIVADPRRIRRQLGYLPQDFGFYPHLTGESMLRFLLVLKGVQAPQGQKRLAAELLDRVNLSHAARRKVKGYSGGMRQRLGIAQALAGDPKLLVVDEPTAGLDPEERLRFYRLLAELAEDRTVLLSTHIVDDISVLCPRVAIMYDGRFVADTTPAEARGRLAGTIYQGAVAKDDLARIDREYRVTQAILIEGRNQVRIHLPEGRPPAGFEAAEPTLEDAYLLLAQANGEGRHGNGQPLRAAEAAVVDESSRGDDPDSGTDPDPRS
ncbi:MAG: ABC transporter ATP-binding protein [Gemmatimonadota bacterium]|nr:ABC transporter ATP-binding protein [Gemmatimonadota bacterium]MDE2870130.1 ABC transporter ATP-binding protein [Gemmatimonadota bacterium]